MKKIPELACQLCYPGAIDIGELGECVWLSKIKGKYCLFFGQGHKDDIIHTFRIKPFSEPDIDELQNGTMLLDDRSNWPLIKGKPNFPYKDTKFYRADKYCDHMLLNMFPIGGYQLIKACMKKPGYYRPSMRGSGLNFNMWVFFKCGELIEKYEKKTAGRK